MCETKRCVGEGGSGNSGTQRACPKLSGEEVRADEGQDVGEEEEQVVADSGRLEPVPDDPDGRIAGEGVAERESRAKRPEDIRVEEMQR